MWGEIEKSSDSNANFRCTHACILKKENNEAMEHNEIMLNT